MPFVLFDTTLGRCGLAWSDAGITSIQLPEATKAATEARLRNKLPEGAGDERIELGRARPRSVPSWVSDAVARLQRHLEGSPQRFDDLPLDLSAQSDLGVRIYRALQKVPSGSKVTYGELAVAAGASVGAARAVGRAMGTNPWPIIVPCHRVTAAGGKPGGFSAYGGLVTKEKLLALEGVNLKVTGSLFDATEGDLPYDRDAACSHLTASDRVLAKHMARVGPLALKLHDRTSTFSSLAEAIVYQQLNGKAAATIFGRFEALFPRRRLDPDRLLAMEDEPLRGAGLSKNKLAALRDLATRASQGKVPSMTELAKLPDESIVETLTEVRGIGRWTVEMLLIFRLGRPDVLPTSDYGIKKGFSILFHRGKARDELPTTEAMLRRAEAWRPFRSAASWYLWRATDAQ